MDNAKLKKQVKDKFTEYLTFHNCRKTPERFAILDHIYSTKGHFDINSLYKSMIDINFRVSKATLYNTIELLLDCGLVVKHQFGGNVSTYERAYGNDNHSHLICIACGNVQEIKNGNLFAHNQQKKIKKFTIHYYRHLQQVRSRKENENKKLASKINGK
jgi:Fur family ferric uptake transcriptional regulator